MSPGCVRLAELRAWAVGTRGYGPCWELCNCDCALLRRNWAATQLVTGRLAAVVPSLADALSMSAHVGGRLPRLMSAVRMLVVGLLGHRGWGVSVGAVGLTRA